MARASSLQMKKLNRILLIDDDPADNLFHKIVIEEMKGKKAKH